MTQQFDRLTPLDVFVANFSDHYTVFRIIMIDLDAAAKPSKTLLWLIPKGCFGQKFLLGAECRTVREVHFDLNIG